MATPALKSDSGYPSAGLQGVFSAPNGVLFLVCLMYALTYIDRINVNTAGPVLQKDLHLNASQLGWVFSAFGWAYVCLQVSGGWLSDRFGARRTLTVCGIIWSVSTILMGVVGSFAALIVCRVLLGLGEGATFPTATRALSDWASPGQRGYVQGITHSFARFGTRLQAGVRVEGTSASFLANQFDVIGRKFVPGTLVPVAGSQDYIDALPSVQFQYRFGGDTLLRLGLRDGHCPAQLRRSAAVPEI
jgi:MFS family permease